MSAVQKDPAVKLKPVVNHNPALQGYYKSLESRIGYRLLLGNTRHFGYWDKDTFRVFPLSGPLRRMEEKMYRLLNLGQGSKVLDAGCGVGHVALYMAERGLQVTGIDVVDHHLHKAERNISRAGKPGSRVTVQKMDYQHLETFEDDSFDGVYTMETFVHATEPHQVLKGFHRVLRPGGRIVMHEYDHDDDSGEIKTKPLANLMNDVSGNAAMPVLQQAKRGYYKQLLEEAGFVDVQERDYSENVRPMLRLFWLLAVIPYHIIAFCNLERYFVNAVAGAWGYHTQKYWRYLAISARKPEAAVDDLQKGIIKADGTQNRK
ncbi:Methyltransferase type 11, partial [Metarhizium majus ARSEF 297]